MDQYRVKKGSKGALVWQAKGVPFWIKAENGLPAGPYHLLITRNVLKPEDVKFFLSNAPASTPVDVLLSVAFSRWPIERMFEDGKSELGLGHFEVRRFASIQRHLILTCVSHLFLAEFCLSHRGKKSGIDPLPSAGGDPGPGAALVSRGPMLASPSRIHRGATELNPTPQRRRPPQPSKTHPAPIAPNRPQIKKPGHLQLAMKVAL